VAICPAAAAQKLLNTMRAHPLGQAAALIGEVTEDSLHWVQIETVFGSTRIIDWPVGEQLPRIC
jgi:hydrogenase expression/formation protein HypE